MKLVRKLVKSPKLSLSHACVGAFKMESGAYDRVGHSGRENKEYIYASSRQFITRRHDMYHFIELPHGLEPMSDSQSRSLDNMLIV